MAVTLSTSSSFRQNHDGTALFAAAFHNDLDGVALTRVKDGLVVEANAAWLSLTGYSREEAIGTTTVALGIWGDPATRSQLLAPLLAGDATMQAEYALHAKGGGHRAVRVDGTRLMLDGAPHMLSYLRDITGRRDSAQVLQGKLGFIQQLTSRAPVMLFQFRQRLDRSGHFPYVTEHSLHVFGVSPQELMADGAKAYAAIHPDDGQAMRDAIKVSARDLTPWRHEFRVVHVKDTVLWMYGDALPQRQPDGSVLWHGALTDVTERKREHEELVKTRELMAQKAQALRIALDNMSQGIVSLDADANITLFNQNFLEFLDLPQSLLEGDKVNGADVLRYQQARIDFGSDLSLLDPQARAYVAAGAMRSAAEQYIRKTHTGRTLEIKTLPLPGGGAVRTYADVTHFVEAQDALRESELRFRSLTALSSDWYWEQDDNFRFVRVDGRAFDNGEVDRAAFMGRTRWEHGDHGDHGVSAAIWAEHQKVLASHLTFRNFEMQLPGVTGAMSWTSISGLPIFDAQEVFRGYRGIGRDITEHKRNEDENQRLAFYDALTGLPNRRLLLNRLSQTLTATARSLRHAALLFIDLDNFKDLNDTLGHDLGDKLLEKVASRLLTCVRQGDTVARFGGDEFVVMLEDLNSDVSSAINQVKTVGEKILAALNQPFDLSGVERYSTPSIGIAVFSGHQQSMDEVLKRADLAMYQAKAAGRNTLRFFDPALQAAVADRVALEADLRYALEHGLLLVFYQPIVDEKGAVIGVEALARWPHPQRGMVAPANFIPMAEQTGLILPLGRWVLQTACEQLMRWSAEAATQALCIAVNVSAREFRQPEFATQVMETLRKTGANPKQLQLELTESLLLSDVQDAIRKMEQLKSIGVRFSLDDFGTGYSSLTYLKRLPLDQLKIDQSFVRDVLTDPNDAAIARTVVALAHSLGLSVVAEGVETKGQRDFLLASGCKAFQGYLFGQPVPADELDLLGPSPGFVETELPT